MFNLRSFFKKRGGAAVNTIILFVLCCGLGYFAYTSYRSKYNIMIYDVKGINQVIQMPPFSERLTDADRELFGECDINVGIGFQQICEFYRSFCAEHGFAFSKPKKDADMFTIEIRKGLVIEAEFMSTKLMFRWVPALTASQAKKCREKFGSIKMPPEPKDED